MAKKQSGRRASCPVETTLGVIGGQWKVLVIHFLLDGPRRFGELSRLLGSISARTLSKQLRELEADEVVSRKDYQEIPPRVEYSLTPLGESLKPVLQAMEAWGVSVEKKSKNRRRRG